MARPPRSTATSRRRIAGAGLLFAGLCVVAALAGCRSSATNDAAPTSTAPGLSSYSSPADLAQALAAKGITCKLEYEGLRQTDKTLSICVIDTQQATVTIWDRPETVQKFFDAPASGPGATAVGRNWTVDVDEQATAEKVASALGGRVKPPAAGSATTR